MSGQPTAGDTLLAEAQKLFCESASLSYVTVPVLIGRGHLWHHRDTTKPPDLTNPLVFLTGVWDERYLEITEDDIGGVEPAASRSISLVVAEYGMGKSELLRQVSTYLTRLRRDDDTLPEPLPIDLAWCRERKHLLDKPLGPDDFWNLVCGGLCKKAEVDPAAARDEIRDRLRRGGVVLILDGLDELILDSDHTRAQDRHFFEGLAGFVGNDPSAPVRIVVSMRLEYLLALTSGDAKERTDTLQKQFAAAIDFVELGFLSDSFIRAFLEKKNLKSLTPEAVQPDLFFNRAQGQFLLIDVLRRPLYLRLFYDLLSSPALLHKQEELLRIEHVAELFETFIEHAAHFEPPPESDPTPDGLPLGQWDIEKLAAVVLEYYDQAQDRIPREKLADCIQLDAQPGLATETLELTRQHYVHKCPFLQRAPKQEMRFSHRAFLEVLTAQGIALALAAESPRTEPFDNLVANVDMRKFLTYFVEKYLRLKKGQPKMDPEKCYVKQTRRGNAMEGPGLAEWVPPLEAGGETWRELERHREQLLLSMIRPELPHPAVMDSISWFLDHEDDGLHPRYLMYNYEAVAVNVRYRWWANSYQAVSERFSGVLERRLDWLLPRLAGGITRSTPSEVDLVRAGLMPPPAGGSDSTVEFLLLHRIVDIARRLHYEWIGRRVKEVRRAADQCAEEKVARRIRNVLEQVEQDVLPTAPRTAPVPERPSKRAGKRA